MLVFVDLKSDVEQKIAESLKLDSDSDMDCAGKGLLHSTYFVYVTYLYLNQFLCQNVTRGSLFSPSCVTVDRSFDLNMKRLPEALFQIRGKVCNKCQSSNNSYSI